MFTPIFLQIDEQLVQSSGKFLILDRLLPALKRRGHKVKRTQSCMWCRAGTEVCERKKVVLQTGNVC